MSKYVKFAYERAVPELAPFAGVVELNGCRQKLLERRLIGVDSSGTSFGNLSLRDGATSSFHITGSGTGGLRELTLADCAKVVAYNFEKNWLRYEGSTIPSSESLTHAAIYEADAKAAIGEREDAPCKEGGNQQAARMPHETDDRNHEQKRDGTV